MPSTFESGNLVVLSSISGYGLEFDGNSVDPPSVTPGRFPEHSNMGHLVGVRNRLVA